MSRINLGTVTAYGLAVQHGYVGSEDEFGEMMAGISQGVETVGQAVEEAQAAATLSGASADASEASSIDSEAWAVGKRSGADVGSDDPAYHNNSKYYAGQAEAAAQTAQQYAGHDVVFQAYAFAEQTADTDGVITATVNVSAVAPTGYDLVGVIPEYSGALGFFFTECKVLTASTFEIALLRAVGDTETATPGVRLIFKK